MASGLLTEDNDVVQTLPADTAQKALTGRVHERSADSRLENVDSRALGDAIEFRPKFGVAVADDELGPFTKGCDLAEPLGSPCLAGFAGDGDMDNRLRVHIDDEEGEQRSKPDVIGLQEVASPNGVVAKERLPGLTIARRSYGHDVSLDGALGNASAELEQLSPNALRAPGALVTSHGLDQFHRFRRET